MAYVEEMRARARKTLTGCSFLIIGRKKLKMVSKCLKLYVLSDSTKKHGDYRLRYGKMSDDARAPVRARKFLKCLKWPETYSNYVEKWFWAFWNFDGRVRARHDLCMTFDGMTFWPLTWSLCDVNMNDSWWLLRKISMIMWFYKMASRWRHDDVMILAMLEKPDFMDLDIWLKFEELRMMDFGDILDTRNGGNKEN